MADLAEGGDPDYYSERYTGNKDYGGVHGNSGIPKHAYYLAVNGGRNAGEARGHNHEGPVGTGRGLAEAEQIFYLLLPPSTSASLACPQQPPCPTRAATVAAAKVLYGAGSQQAISTGRAWGAVGVR
jgi:Zn-dependent metalloprotease